MQAVIKRGFGVTLGVIALAIGFTAPERERAYAQGGDADTHGRDATPDYGRVFIQDQVSRLDVKIAASDWQIAIDDMTDMAGAAGGQFGGGQQPGGGQPPGGFPGGGQPPGGFPDGGQPPTGFPGRGFTPESTAACTNLLEGSACAFGNPPTSGRCVQTADGGALGVCRSRWAAGPLLPAAAARIRHAMTSNSCPGRRSIFRPTSRSTVRRFTMSASGSRAIRVWSIPGGLATRRCRFG